ncbi:MAG TPA: hypothetical protein VFU07_03210 [Candidatus Lumbricidophila sp.]|nr:hypothetical protein [Candidatus Lumbricidophila sp.]
MPTSASPSLVRRLRWVLIGLLAAESVALVGVVGWLLLELVTQTPSSYATALALLIMVVIAAVFLVAVTVSVLRRQAWAPSGAIVWQVLQISVAIGAFQGLFARPDIGWLLLIPALAIIGLLIWQPVRQTFRSRAVDR